MSDWQDEYWCECISIAADECGLVLTKEQVGCLASSARAGHENYGMASGNTVASGNRWAEIEREKDDISKKLRREQDKITCRECKGSGSITTYGGTFQSTSSCWKCNGHGRHDP